MFDLPYQVALEGAVVFVRISAIMFALPIFGDQTTPVRVRVLLSVALAFLIYPLIDAKWLPTIPSNLVAFSMLIGKEILIGLMIGYVARIAFDSMVSAAKIVSFQMGFGTANLFMPSADYPMDSFTGFHRTLMILLFFSLNLHQIYFSALVETFSVIPSGGLVLKPGLGMFLIDLSASLFIVAVKLAAPVLIALMFAMSALGLIARTVPQMNVFILSFPISFFLGLLIYIACLPFFPEWLSQHFATSQQQILTSIKGMTP